MSDSAALHELVADMLTVPNAIRCLRDPTRGGLSSALNEIAAQSKVSIQIEESKILVRDEVKGACELLGLDPLYVANEGKLVAIVAPSTPTSWSASCGATRAAKTPRSSERLVTNMQVW